MVSVTPRNVYSNVLNRNDNIRNSHGHNSHMRNSRGRNSRGRNNNGSNISRKDRPASRKRSTKYFS